MEKRATIKDIAKQAEVSAGTVHRALYGKPGVGEDVRVKILAIAAECGYRPNYVASSLKRKTLRLVAAFPVPTERNRFYYSHIWQGFRDYMREMGDYNIQVVELPYAADRSEELDAVYKRYDGEIDGLITVGREDERESRAVGRYITAGIPVVLACDDMRDSGRLCCVQANYEVIGRMAAELLESQLPKGARVLLCAGDVLVPSHYKVVQGFTDFLREVGEPLQTTAVYGYGNEQDLREQLSARLRAEPVAGIFSVTARGSVLAADLLRELSLAGKIRLLASDLFPENIRNMREGLVQNILFKNPYRQAHLAAKVLTDYMIRGERPAEETRYVDSIMIFRSNLSMYDVDSFQ